MLPSPNLRDTAKGPILKSGARSVMGEARDHSRTCGSRSARAGSLELRELGLVRFAREADARVDQQEQAR
ncbi:hypothetical protein [Nannocystis pusilla]|uniref:hypothetical protein n=1 Tax=Nannocystis pusilla TaxID=889268 RepID=UPI003B834378